MNEEPDSFQPPKAKGSSFSPRPVTLIIPPGQEVKIVPGPELCLLFADGSKSNRATGGGPGDSSASPKKGTGG